MLELVALRLLCAVAQPHIYSETVVIADCAGGEFTAKGKTVKHPGWKALEDAYRAKMKDAEPKKEGAEKALPELTEGQTLSVSAAIVKEGKSSPPQHFTKDTLLSAMETAGKEDMPEDAERKGLSFGQLRQGFLCALFFRLCILHFGTVGVLQCFPSGVLHRFSFGGKLPTGTRCNHNGFRIDMGLGHGTQQTQGHQLQHRFFSRRKEWIGIEERSSA